MNEAEKLVEDFRNKSFHGKVSILSLAEKAMQRKEEERKVRECLYKDHVVELMFNGMAIVCNYHNPSFEDAPYTFCYKTEKEEWKSAGACYPSLEEAILGAIGHKHCGLNSQFALFASKMLGLI